MKNFNSFWWWIENTSTSNKELANAVQKNKDKVKGTLAQTVNEQMNQLFLSETSKITEGAREETEELANENEVILAEEQLAAMFWKGEAFNKLKQVNENIHTLSVASVLDDYDTYEEHELELLAA